MPNVALKSWKEKSGNSSSLLLNAGINLSFIYLVMEYPVEFDSFSIALKSVTL
jgi:hypothetical protein